MQALREVLAAEASLVCFGHKFSAFCIPIIVVLFMRIATPFGAQSFFSVWFGIEKGIVYQA